MSEDYSFENDSLDEEFFSDDDDVENYRGYKFISEQSFVEHDYDPEELVVIYRNAVRDLEKSVKILENGCSRVNAVATETRKDMNELSVAHNDLKSEYYELKNQQLTLQEEFAKYKKEMSDKLHDATESYFAEVRAHQKTLNELYDLKHGRKQMGTQDLSKPINIVAAVEVEVRNGKISKMVLKENVDKARKDLIDEMELLKKTNEEHAVQIKNHDVVVLEHKMLIEKEKATVTELNQKVNDLEIVKAQHENSIKERDGRIADLQKVIDDLQAKFDGKLMDIESKLDDRGTIVETVVVEEEEVTNYEIGELTGEQRRLQRKKQLEEQKQRLGIKRGARRAGKGASGARADQSGLLSGMVGLDVKTIGASEVKQGPALGASGRRVFRKSSAALQQSQEGKEKGKGAQMGSRSVLAEVKVKKRKADPSEKLPEGTKTELLDGGKQKTINVGIRTEGVVLVGEKTDTEKRVIVLGHKGYKRVSADDLAVVDSLQTKHGFFVTDGVSKTQLLTEEGDIRTWEVMDGIKNIGESERGLLVVTSKLELLELTGKHTQRKIMKLEEQPVGPIFMMKDMVFFVNAEKKLRSYVVGMNFKCGNKVTVQKLVKVGSRLYAIRDGDAKFIDVYDERLNRIMEINCLEEVTNIINFNLYALVTTVNKIYYVSKTKIILVGQSDKKPIAATFSGTEKHLNVVFVCADKKVYKSATPLDVHAFKGTMIKGVQCTICKKINDKKMVFCGDCGMPCHSHCINSYAGELIEFNSPCIIPPKK